MNCRLQQFRHKENDFSANRIVIKAVHKKYRKNATDQPPESTLSVYLLDKQRNEDAQNGAIEIAPDEVDQFDEGFGFTN